MYACSLFSIYLLNSYYYEDIYSLGFYISLCTAKGKELTATISVIFIKIFLVAHTQNRFLCVAVLKRIKVLLKRPLV